jgi:hypothetical protein
MRHLCRTCGAPAPWWHPTCTTCQDAYSPLPIDQQIDLVTSLLDTGDPTGEGPGFIGADQAARILAAHARVTPEYAGTCLAARARRRDNDDGGDDWTPYRDWDGRWRP